MPENRGKPKMEIQFFCVENNNMIQFFCVENNNMWMSFSKKLVTLQELQKCLNWSTMHVFDGKKLNFHFLNSLFLLPFTIL